MEIYKRALFMSAYDIMLSTRRTRNPLMIEDVVDAVRFVSTALVGMLNGERLFPDVTLDLADTLEWINDDKIGEIEDAVHIIRCANEELASRQVGTPNIWRQ